VVNMLDTLSSSSQAAPAMTGADDRLTARLTELNRDALLAMYDAAAEATARLAALAKIGLNPVTAVLGGATVVEEWMHYPQGDVIDAVRHSQFYYHAHASGERVDREHGHFHAFVRATRACPELQPANWAEGTSPGDAAAVTHLVGLSTDASGRLIRLFTTNRWVTGEVWYDAASVIRMLDQFDITAQRPCSELNRWITAVVAMFRPQIENLIWARDAKLREFAVENPGRDVYEDRALQVTSAMPVDFLTQIGAIEAALARAAA
jgi:uncharacterized protein DUF6969